MFEKNIIIKDSVIKTLISEEALNHPEVYALTNKNLTETIAKYFTKKDSVKGVEIIRDSKDNMNSLKAIKKVNIFLILYYGKNITEIINEIDINIKKIMKAMLPEMQDINIIYNVNSLEVKEK